MAYYAELKRRKWYCINGTRSMIHVYRKMLYDQWYESLTDEQKQRLKERKKQEHESELRQLEHHTQMLLSVMGVMAGAVCGNFKMPNIHDKYHGLYNADGSLNKNFKIKPDTDDRDH